VGHKNKKRRYTMIVLQLIKNTCKLGIDIEDKRNRYLGDERLNRFYLKFNFDLNAIVGKLVMNTEITDEEKREITKHYLIHNYEFVINLEKEPRFLNHVVNKIADKNYLYEFDIYRESKIYLSEILDRELSERNKNSEKRFKI
jgi:hypothetical protein